MLKTFSCPIPNAIDSIHIILDELHQTIDLFLEWDWSTYLKNYGQAGAKYDKVQPSTSLKILEKIAENDKNKSQNVFSSLSLNKQSTREKQRAQVVRQLKELVGDWGRMCAGTNSAIEINAVDVTARSPVKTFSAPTFVD